MLQRQGLNIKENHQVLTKFSCIEKVQKWRYIRVIPKSLKNTENSKENLGLGIMMILISLINNKAYKYFCFLFFLTNYKGAFGIYNKFYYLPHQKNSYLWRMPAPKILDR